MFVPSGTENPACSAIHAAGLPTMLAFNLAPAQFFAVCFYAEAEFF